MTFNASDDSKRLLALSQIFDMIDGKNLPAMLTKKMEKNLLIMELSHQQKKILQRM